MDAASIQVIPLLNLALAFIPALLVVGIMLHWSLKGWHALYAIGRMLLQLLLIGFFLLYIFETKYAALVLIIIAIMLFISSWIALSPINSKQPHLYFKVLAAIAIACISTLILTIVGILELDPWYMPRYVIPIAGMLFANAMNTVSLAAERYESELEMGSTYQHARGKAFQTALIPQINTMLAVGLVSLPGMMTGQILSGVSPLIAVRYQIMILCIVFGSSGIAVAVYLFLSQPQTPKPANFHYFKMGKQ